MDEHEKNTMNTWIISNQRSQIFIKQHVFFVYSCPFYKGEKDKEEKFEEMLQEEEGEGGYGSYKEAFRDCFLFLHGFHIRKER